MAEMQPTIEILVRIKDNSAKNKSEVFTKLFRYLLRPDIYFTAYQNLYSNKGAGTKGVNNDTADGFSEAKIVGIIKSLQNGTYEPMPVKRVYIAKGNGTVCCGDTPHPVRSLGIPTFTDKLVQEVLKMILEAVYEPLFSDNSHGFRPNRSCHTALTSIKKEFTGARWFIEDDIKGCNINHTKLVCFIGNKIKDNRLIQLIYKFLRAGYLENWKYNKIYSGCPQGSGCSPVLANIYLHELDKFILQLKKEFDKPCERALNKDYQDLQYQLKLLRTEISNCNGSEKEILIKKHKEMRAKLQSLPRKSQTDKKIEYIRYADDFIIAVNGNHEDCIEIKRKIGEFISGNLKMELSSEKTLITHSNNYARFLGYDIRVRRDNSVKPNGNHKMRTLNGKVELNIPLKDKIEKFLFSKKIIVQKQDGKLFPVHRKTLLRCFDLEIVASFNAELRGICNYYSIASNYCMLNYFAYFMEYSCLKILAKKHKSSISKIREKYRNGKGHWGIPYETKSGNKICNFVKYGECKKDIGKNFEIISNTAIHHAYCRTSLETRLNANKCELCGAENATHYEIHYVNKVKNLKGKQPW